MGGEMAHRLHRSLVMKASLLLALVALAACSRPAPRQGQGPVRAAATTTSDVQTIDNADVRPTLMEPPPTLTDEGSAVPKPKAGLAQPDAPPPPTPADEALRANLPFAPAIAMDPVDGSKISIRASTPMFDYRGHLFYFSSEANKRTFMAAPETYTKGVFSHL
jgi:YHS domain-containing protein